MTTFDDSLAQLERVLMTVLDLGFRKLRGVINVAAYDLDGSVLAVELRDDKGACFLVADDAKGEALLRLVGKTVEVTGNISQEVFGYMISVETFRRCD